MAKKKVCSFLAAVCVMGLFCSLASAAQIDLSGDWLFKTGDDASWAKPDFNDGGWAKINVPGMWDSQGYQKYNGVAWYRKKVSADAKFAGEPLFLLAGTIYGNEDAYVNGIQVGSGQGGEILQIYSIPQGVMKSGENVIAVRVNGSGGESGISIGPVAVMTATFGQQLPVKISYNKLDDKGKGKISVKFSNPTIKAYENLPVKFNVYGFDGKEISSGDFKLSLQPGKDTAQEINIDRGSNMSLKVRLEIQVNDSEKTTIERYVPTDFSETDNEHVWLHAEGGSIRTSPYSDRPDEVFIGAGACRHRGHSGDLQDIASWLKERNCNMIRFSVEVLPWPMNGKSLKDATSLGDGYVFKATTPQEVLDHYIDPFVQLCKKMGMYTFIDFHAYFHRYLDKDSWFPHGDLWNEQDVQTWINYWVEVAKRYKDEPWVAGYELCNEPCNMPPEYSRECHLRCIKAIRAIDTKHIIILGNDNFDHAQNMEEVWGDIDFRPDEPYNQAVFAFHEYTNAFNPDMVEPILQHIQQKYKVPVMCTEFGYGVVTPDNPPTVEEMMNFEKNMLDMMKRMKLSWDIYSLRGNYPYLSEPVWQDLWVPAAREQASPLPKKGTVEPKPAKIYCGADAVNIPADGTTSCVISAIIQDAQGGRLTKDSNPVTFKVSGDAVLEGSNPASAVEGIATIKLKSGKKGKVTVSAGADGLTGGSVVIKITKAVKK